LPAKIAWALIHRNENVWDYGKINHKQNIYLHYNQLDENFNFESVLDLGCNEGYLLKRLNSSKKIGIDCGNLIVERCKKYIAEENVETTVINYNLNKLFCSKLPDMPKADIVICNDVIYYLSPKFIPPILFWAFDIKLFRHFKNRLFNNMEKLTNKAMIINDHQQNKGVIRELKQRYKFIEDYSNFLYIKN
jgi:SAM-dependent methyltransferase